MSPCPQQPQAAGAGSRRPVQGGSVTRIEVPPIYTVRMHGYGELRDRRRRGELERFRRGAYRVPTTAATPWDRARHDLLTRCAAVAQRLTTTFAFSHTTAALLHGWPVTLTPRAVHVVQRVKASTHSGDLVRHHRPGLSDAGTQLVEGMPVTSGPETIVDCALALRPREALVVADAGMRSLADVDEFDRPGPELRQEHLRAELLGLLSERGPCRHAIRARAVLQLANGLAQSPGETRTR